MGEESKGGEIQPMSQERRHGGGTPGMASVTGAPDRGGIHSLSGVIDTPLPLRHCSVCPKKEFIFPIPRGHVQRPPPLMSRQAIFSSRTCAGVQTDIEKLLWRGFPHLDALIDLILFHTTYCACPSNYT